MGQAEIRYRPRTFRHGLVFVLIPLILGSSLLIFMNQIWSNAEKMILAEERQSAILTHCYYALNLWAEATVNLLASALSDDKRYSKTYRDCSERLRAEFSEVQRLSGENRIRNIEKLQAICLKSVEDLGKLPHTVSNDPLANIDLIQNLPLVFRKCYGLPGKMRPLLEDEWKRLQDARQAEDAQALMSKILVWLCAGGNIALSLFLAWLFASRFTNRLRIVTDNARILPRVQKLDVRLSGDDELAFLDASLHAACTKLSSTAEHRRTILGMVAHDMRSPLLAARLSLQAAGELRQRATAAPPPQELERSLVLMDSILTHVQSLLTVEKSSAEKSAVASQPGEEGQNPDPIRDLPSATKSCTAEGDESMGQNMPDSLTHSLFSFRERLPVSQRIRIFASDMLFSPKIFNKCLWLVLIPLFVQSVFLLLINHQIQVCETIVREERAICNIVMGTNRVFLELLKANASEGIYNVNCDPTTRQAVVRNFANVADAFPQVIAAANDFPEWLWLLKKLQGLLSEHLNDISRPEDLNSGMSVKEITARFDRTRTLGKASDRLSKKVNLLLTKESFRLQDLQADEKDARQSVTGMLGWGIAANFLLALAMLAAFGNNIKRRISLLVGRAANLGGPVNFSDRIAGADELTYLDIVFHHTQERLIKSASDRAAVMNVLAREMSAPLRQARQLITAFQQREENKVSAREVKSLSRAEGNIDRVLALVDDLLTMETLEAGQITLERAECNLIRIAEESIATVSSLAGAKEIELINECRELPLTADKSRLHQTMINLLANAIKFSPEKTKIIVSSIRQADWLRICVTDQGPGMDEETRSRVFEKFYQAEGVQKKEGFGLGLAICRMIVEAHGGRIGVESKPGEGSTFWFDLPNSLLVGPLE